LDSSILAEIIDEPSVRGCLEEAEKSQALVNVQFAPATRPGASSEYAEWEVVGFFFVFFLRIFFYVCSVEYAAFAFPADHCGD
jgi:hypothetical protein